MYLDMLYNASTSIEDNLEVATWELLTFTEYEKMNEKKITGSEKFLFNKRMGIKDRFREFSASLNYYPCSYLFMFRRVLLDQKPFSKVSISIFNYYVYEINIFISYLLLV